MRSDPKIGCFYLKLIVDILFVPVAVAVAVAVAFVVVVAAAVVVVAVVFVVAVVANTVQRCLCRLLETVGVFASVGVVDIAVVAVVTVVVTNQSKL